MPEYNICFSIDDNYAEQLGVAITSILKNSKKDESFKFYILDGGISTISKSLIEKLTKIKKFEISYVQINQEDFKECPLLSQMHFEHKDYHVTIPTYFRFKLPSLLPKEVKKVLYLDCDIVVLDSLKELYDTDLGENYTGMILDSGNEEEAERLNLTTYCNAGVMLINLEKWRKDNIEKKLFDYTIKNKDKIFWQDQDVLNIVLKDNIKILPRKWNFQFFLYAYPTYDKSRYNFKIIHYAGQYKPWNFNATHPLFEEYYAYLNLTPWAHQLNEYRRNAVEKYFMDTYLGSNFYNIVLDQNQKYIDHQTNLKFAERSGEIKDLYTYIDKIKSTEFPKIYDSVNEAKSSIINTEISKVYKHLEETKNNILNVEISKIYKQLEETKNNLINTEVTKLYNQLEETNTEISKIYSQLEETRNNFIYSEINKLYSFIEETKNNFIHSEITKLYNDIEEIKNNFINIEIAKMYNQLEENKNNLFYSMDEKLCKKESELYKEIEKAYKYSEDIVSKKFIENYQDLRNTENNLKSEILGYREWISTYLKDELTKQTQYNNLEIERLINTLPQVKEETLNSCAKIIEEKFEEKFEALKAECIQETERKLQNQKDVFDIKYDKLEKKLNIFPMGLFIKLSNKYNNFKNSLNERSRK